MGEALFGALIAGLVISGLVVGAYVQYRKIVREAKNYERGLKMVPFLIHLPPPSDDHQRLQDKSLRPATHCI